ncbi:MAG: site-specific DNA-methyltransferase [Ferruginibacter sp.]
MPTLNWIGKEKVINHHQDVPFKVLEQQYIFNTDKESENKIIHGDNLEALKALLPEYEGKIKCIYIDPPYNTGNESWVYNDNVNHPKIKKWLGQVVGKESEDLTRHDKWLCMMYPRLKLLHRLLSKDGSIFISLDEIETTNLRLIMNEIFGEANFIAQLILLCNPKGRSQDKYFSTNHEYITVYSKSQKPKESFSIIKDEALIEKEYKLVDENGY